MIIGFAYFYTAIAFDPVQQADNLRKQGGFIPGIRPGPQTEHYLSKVLNHSAMSGEPKAVIINADGKEAAAKAIRTDASCD